MRTFMMKGVTAFEPVEVIIRDDSLALPDNLENLSVIPITYRNIDGSFLFYQEEEAIICFTKVIDAMKWLATEVKGHKECSWNVTIKFLVLECQYEQLTKLIVR